MMQKESVDLIYDGECPVCKLYCTNIKADEGVDINLVDARQSGTLMDEVTRRGMDIDQGMVLRKGDTYFYGSDAMREIALRAQKSGPFSFMNRIVFNTKAKSDIFYPIGKFFRNIVLFVLGIEFINNLEPKNVLKSQLGAQWNELDPNIQKRFDREPEEGERIVYKGVMQEMRRSRMGWLFATLTRVIGNPLVPDAGRDVPMDVVLFKREGHAGVFWQRTYFLPDKKPYTVVSSKQQDAKGQMMECVGGGFGMFLRVYVQEGQLHFRSYRYFWNFAGYKIPLPHWLSPGEVHVIHADLGNGDFFFTISMVHAVLGETFYQAGIFRRA